MLSYLLSIATRLIAGYFLVQTLWWIHPELGMVSIPFVFWWSIWKGADDDIKGKPSKPKLRDFLGF